MRNTNTSLPRCYSYIRFSTPEQLKGNSLLRQLELSKKYAALSEEATQLKLERQDLVSENQQLKQKLAALQTESDQAKKELTEANDLLIEMRVELNNWKADVLGFRDEMRQADKVQLETLLKILKVLGGEVPADLTSEPPSQDKDT